jgi:hypothetical protein
MMHDRDSAIVAVKPTNNAGQPAMERRAGTKGNADQQSTHRTQIRARVTQALGRVRQADQRFAVNTQGKSRMLESGSSGSVRGRSAMSIPTANLDPERTSFDRSAGHGVAFLCARDGTKFALTIRR